MRGTGQAARRGSAASSRAPRPGLLGTVLGSNGPSGCTVRWSDAPLVIGRVCTGPKAAAPTPPGTHCAQPGTLPGDKRARRAAPVRTLASCSAVTLGLLAGLSAISGARPEPPVCAPPSKPAGREALPSTSVPPRAHSPLHAVDICQSN